MKGQRWIIIAFSTFMALLVVWSAAAWFLSSATAESLPFSLSLRSNLEADYAPDESVEPQGVFRLSIIGDALRDSGLQPEEVEDQSQDFMLKMSSPIPSATARNFQGEAPYTATSTATATPTETLTPTQTPTKTPLPTKTTKPTKTPKPAGDRKDPQILGWTLDPTPGPLGTCSAMITVSDLHIVDPAYSSGIEWIKLKYYDPVKDEWIVSSPLIPNPPSGWKEGQKWEDYYTLSIEINIEPAGHCSIFNPDGGIMVLAPRSLPGLCDDDLEIVLKAWVRDEAGHDTYRELGEYTVPECCGD